MTGVTVKFTEVVVRELTFNLDLPEGVTDLFTSDVHELMDEQNAWDQPSEKDWLGGDITDRFVEDFAVHTPA